VLRCIIPFGRLRTSLGSGQATFCHGEPFDTAHPELVEGVSGIEGHACRTMRALPLALFTKPSALKFLRLVQSCRLNQNNGSGFKPEPAKDIFP
jgi:hypothetical protein